VFVGAELSRTQFFENLPLLTRLLVGLEVLHALQVQFPQPSMQQVAVAYQFEFLLDRALEMNRGYSAGKFRFAPLRLRLAPLLDLTHLRFHAPNFLVNSLQRKILALLDVFAILQNGR